MSIKPKLISELAQEIDSTVDLFICAASFESRCGAISSNLTPEKIDRVVVLRNETYADEIASEFSRLHAIWGPKAKELSVSSDQPLVSFDNLLELFSRISAGASPQRILADISTMTRETLMMLIRVISMSCRPIDRIQFVYATADDYYKDKEHSEKWLSKGVKEIRSVVGYPGRLAPSKDTHLIVLAGFEDYRAYSLIKELEPALLSVGYGDRSEQSTNPHQDENESRVRRLASLLGDINPFVFSCYDPASTAATLSDLVDGHSEFNHIIVPMNTKISTLGASVFACANDSVQLYYSQPEIYNTIAYSLPGSHYYSFDWQSLSQLTQGGPE